MGLPEQLRAWCIAVRRKPSPIADAIPMVNKAADELQRLSKIEDEWAALSQDDGKAEKEIERLTADYAAATHLLADRDAQIERLTALNSALTDKSNGYVVENARLTAELATLRASAASVQADQRAEIDAANAALDELREDAERLDWLECNVMNGKLEIAQSIYKTGYEFGFHQSRIDAVVCSGTLRSAIDAARALSKGTTRSIS